MAINLNIDKYGAQFNAFVNFANANANNEDTLACIDGIGRNAVLLDPDGKPRTIVAKNDNDKIKSLFKNQRFNRSVDQKALNNAVRDLFKETVLKVCGVKTIRELPAAVRKAMKEDDFKGDGGHPLSVRRILAVTRAIHAVDDKEIPISGKAAKDILNVILPGSGLEKVKNKGQVFKERMTSCAKASAQTMAANGIAYLRDKDGKLNLDKYTDTFQMDVRRGFKIRLNNGPSISDLGAAKARDAYVDFLTDGRVKTYAEADDKTKLKACTLMIFTTQGFAACAIKGVGNAFDSKGISSRLGPGNGEGGRIDDFNVTKDEKGSITVKANVTFVSPMIIASNEKYISNAYFGNKGSTFSYDFKVTIDAESLDKFVDADWESYDKEAIDAIEDDTTRPYNVKAAADALPEDKRLNLDMSISFAINVDSVFQP